MFASIFGFISVLIGAIVLFTVTNTMSMAVVERTVEIGTLRAIGLRRGGIRAMFVSEGIVLGCFGARARNWRRARAGLGDQPPRADLGCAGSYRTGRRWQCALPARME